MRWFFLYKVTIISDFARTEYSCVNVGAVCECLSQCTFDLTAEGNRKFIIFVEKVK